MQGVTFSKPVSDGATFKLIFFYLYNVQTSNADAQCICWGLGGNVMCCFSEFHWYSHWKSCLLFQIPVIKGVSSYCSVLISVPSVSQYMMSLVFTAPWGCFHVWVKTNTPSGLNWSKFQSSSHLSILSDSSFLALNYFDLTKKWFCFITIQLCSKRITNLTLNFNLNSV